jgi:hypothetical protein
MTRLDHIAAQLDRISRRKVRFPAMKKPKRTNQKTTERLSQLLVLLERHPKRAKLIKVAKATNDQLARALVPLYIAKGKGVEITSIVVSQFWKLHGNNFQAPRVAKAWREHVGYARNTRDGKQITPNGEKYLDVVLAGL